MPFWSPITRDYLCGLAFWLMHSPLRYGPKFKGLKMRVYPVTFCSTFAKFQSKLKMFNNFVISLLYRDKQSCPWPLVFYITVDMYFACLSSRTDYVLRQEKEQERISENQNKHSLHVVTINWLITNFLFGRKIQNRLHFIICIKN